MLGAREGVYVMPIIRMNEPPNEFTWGARRTRLLFNAAPVEDFHPFGYEPEIINAFEHFVELGDVVIDAGASIGFHTCLLSKLVGENGVVMAFEPQLASFNFLMHHVHAINHLNNVVCIREALWKEDIDDLKLWNLEELGYSSFHHYFNAVSYETVPGRMLDTLLINESDHPRVLKIDCEGCEAEVLLGAQRHLQRGIDCVILEFNFKLMHDETIKRDDRVIREFMRSVGYDCFLINIGAENGRGSCGYADPIWIDPNLEIQIRGGHHINVLFSTKEKVKERWKTNGI